MTVNADALTCARIKSIEAKEFQTFPQDFPGSGGTRYGSLLWGEFHYQQINSL
jgi:hypothetical protein